MKKIKKHIPTILYAVLFITVVFLCIYVAEKTDFDAEAKKNIPFNPDESEKTSYVEDVPLSTSENKQPEETFSQIISEETEEKQEENRILYDLAVPRNAFQEEEYLYSQKLTGDGKIELKEVFRTSVGIYVVSETDAKNGDISGTDHCVGIAKIDSYGNLLASLSLDPDRANKFVAGASTAAGFVVVTQSKDANYYYIYVLPYDLTKGTPYRIPAGKNGSLRATQSSFLLFVEYENESLVYSFEEGKMSFQSIPRGTIQEIFEYNGYYLLFSVSERDSSYTVCRLSKQTLTVLQETTYSSATLLSVHPIFEDGKQRFIALENRNEFLWARKFADNAFTETLDSKKIGACLLRNVVTDGTDLLLICSGNVNGIVTLHHDLSSEYPQNASDFIPKNIEDFLFEENTLRILTRSDDDSVALITYKNDSVTYDYFPFKTTKARLLQNIDKTYILFYQNANEVRIVGFGK